MNTHVVTLSTSLAESLPQSPTQPLPLFRILPEGAFRARDGRPAEHDTSLLSVWTLSSVSAAALLDRWQQRAAALVVDYEHQSLSTRQNGQPAPAAGWIESLCYLDGQGLFAGIRWTARAMRHLERDEYRYLSPVFSFDPHSGAVLELQGAALTNTPALDGLEAVTSPASPASLIEAPAFDQVISTRTKDDGMDAARLKTLLGLDPSATEETLLAEVSALEALFQAAAKDAPSTPLSAPLSARLASAFGSVSRCRELEQQCHDVQQGARHNKADKMGREDNMGSPHSAQHNERLPNPLSTSLPKPSPKLSSELLSKLLSDPFVTPLANSVAGEVATPPASKLAEHLAMQLDRLLEQAVAEGRLPRVLMAWAKDLGKRDPEALQAYLDATPPIAALSALQTGGRSALFSQSHTRSALSEEERFVCAQLGISEEGYAQTRSASRVSGSVAGVFGSACYTSENAAGL